MQLLLWNLNFPIVIWWAQVQSWPLWVWYKSQHRCTLVFSSLKVYRCIVTIIYYNTIISHQFIWKVTIYLNKNYYLSNNFFYIVTRVRYKISRKNFCKKSLKSFVSFRKNCKKKTRKSVSIRFFCIWSTHL